MLRLKLVHLWDKMARFIPLMDNIKRKLCAIRWATYKRQIRQYKDIAKSPSIEPKVLVLMGTGIGNAVESTPFVQAIRMLWPKAEITILVPSRDLFDNWCVVNHTEDSPRDLKGQSFNHTFVTWSGSITVCRGYCQLGQIHYTEEGLKLRCTKPEREYNMDMLRRLGYEGPTPPLYVSVRQPGSNIPSGRPRICIVPGGSNSYQWRYKHWPHYEKLVQMLLRQYHGAQLCIIGRENDRVPDGMLALSQVVDLRGWLSPSEAAWVLSNSDLAIGNDCGGMHIADAVEIPSIIIFGPTCEIKNAPANKAIPLRHKVPCAPCQYGKMLLKCNNPICMNGLRPEVVLEHANKFLAAAGYSKQQSPKAAET